MVGKSGFVLGLIPVLIVLALSLLPEGHPLSAALDGALDEFLDDGVRGHGRTFILIINIRFSFLIINKYFGFLAGLLRGESCFSLWTYKVAVIRIDIQLVFRRIGS